MKFINKLFFMLLLSLSLTLLIGCGITSNDEAKLMLEVEKTTIGVNVEVAIQPKVVIGTQEVDLPNGIEFKSSNGAVLTVSSTGVARGVSVGNATVTATLIYEEKELETKLEFSVKAIPITPTNLKIEDGVLTWSAVSNATKYVVNVNGVDNEVSVASFDLKNLALAFGNYEVKVFVLVGDEKSTASTITYVKADPKVESQIYETILGFIDESYTPNMGRDDFNSDYEYETYLRTSKVANAYTRGALLSGLSSAKIKDIVSTLMDVTNSNPSSVKEVKLELDKLRDLDVEPSKLAIIVTELIPVVFDLNIESLEDSIERSEAYISDLQGQLSILKLEQDFVSFYTAFSTHASQEDLETINDYLNGKLDSQDSYQYFIEQIKMDIEFKNSYNIEWWLLSEDPIIVAIVNTLLAAAAAEDTSFFDSFQVNFWIFENVHYLALNIPSELDYIDSLEADIAVQKNIKALVNESSNEFRISITTALTYVYRFYDQIDRPLLQMLGDLSNPDGLTNEEVFLLKDELVDLFKETLPSSKEFENMYLALMVVLYDNLEINANDMVGFSKVLGEIQNQSYMLSLNIFESINLEMVNELTQIIENMYIPEYWDEDLYDYVNGGYDERKVVELIVFVGNFLNDIKEENKDAITALELLNSSTFEAQMDIIIEAIFDRVLEDKNLAYGTHQLITTYLNNKDTFKVLFNMVIKYGDEVFSKFVGTSGKIALDIFNFRDSMMSEEAPAGEDFRNIFNQFLEYHALTIEAITEEEIAAVVELVVLNAKFFIMNNGEEDLEFKQFLDNIDEELQKLLTMIIEFEIELFAKLELNDAAFEYMNLIGRFTPDEAIAIQLFIALDDMMTQSNKVKITNGIDLFFDGILMEPYYLEMVGTDNAGVEEMKDMINDRILVFYTLLEEVTSFDFSSDLTNEQYDDLYNLMYFSFMPEMVV